MPTPDSSLQNPVPLVVDLDGTVIKTDLMWESLARLLRRNPLQIFPILFWWMRGRAFLKKQLVARVKIDPATLSYNEKFLAWLREQKSAGRKIILATASDLQMAKPVADFVGIFDDVLASDGKTNLRSENKLKALVEKFGERGFDYAGNSSADLAVWRGAREAIVVHASAKVLKRAADCAKISAAFPENYSPFPNLKNFLAEFFLRSGYLLAIVAGLLLAAAFPKINVAGFAWVAPALLIFAARKKNSRDAFRAGYVGGLSFWLASLYWLLLIPVSGFPILGWIALGAFLALFFAVWTRLLAGKIGEGDWSQRNLWSLLGAAVWVALEMIRARIFGGFPWSFIGVSQFQMTPFIQFASVTGVYGISFLVVWTSLSFYSAIKMICEKSKSRFAWQPEIFLPLFVVVGLFAYGEVKINSQNPPASTLRVTLIQPSVPQTLIWDENENSNRFQQLLQLSENALTNKTDLLIWPESALPEFNNESYAAIENLVRSNHIWMIFNADDLPDTNSPDFNAAFLFDPDGGCAAIYHKQKLVIFGEYIPLVRWLPFVKWFTPITGSFGAGNSAAQFEINRQDEILGEPSTISIENSGSRELSPHQIIKTSPLICFEDTFPQLARKATRDDTDFLVNLTNDGWFGDSAEQWQHMANSVFRTVENGIPLVRCCNNGVTCWIDANGRVREIFRDASGSIYRMGAMTIELPLQSHAQTFYNRHGDWFGWSCVILTAAVAARRIFARGKLR
jgi:apolipoprotein N-acyltransferase